MLDSLRSLHLVQKVAHNDLKSDNVLVSGIAASEVKMCDFGQATNVVQGVGPFNNAHRAVRRRVYSEKTYWLPTFAHTRRTSWDADIFAFIQLCVTVMFIHKKELVMWIRKHKRMPGQDFSNRAALNEHPTLLDFFTLANSVLQEETRVAQVGCEGLHDQLRTCLLKYSGSRRT